uniref:Uncharacterized protein n=1 Tax=Glossina austeni TaxID=7395 RepID=A0A1A9VRQ1_GLOAU
MIDSRGSGRSPTTLNYGDLKRRREEHIITILVPDCCCISQATICHAENKLDSDPSNATYKIYQNRILYRSLEFELDDLVKVTLTKPRSSQQKNNSFFLNFIAEPKILNTIEIKLEERYRKQETGEFACELAARLRPLLLERILNLWVQFALSTVSISCEYGASYNCSSTLRTKPSTIAENLQNPYALISNPPLTIFANLNKC